MYDHLCVHILNMIVYTAYFYWDFFKQLLICAVNQEKNTIKTMIKFHWTFDSIQSAQHKKKHTQRKTQ